MTPYTEPTKRAKKRRPVSQGRRRQIAARYDLHGPGSVPVRCWYCDKPGHIEWTQPTPRWREGFIRLTGPSSYDYWLEFDHFLPIKWGLNDHPKRHLVLIACSSCNASRGAKYTVSEFWRRRRQKMAA